MSLPRHTWRWHHDVHREGRTRYLLTMSAVANRYSQWFGIAVIAHGAAKAATREFWHGVVQRLLKCEHISPMRHTNKLLLLDEICQYTLRSSNFLSRPKITGTAYGSGWRPDVNHVRPLHLWALRNRPVQRNRSQYVSSVFLTIQLVPRVI